MLASVMMRAVWESKEQWRTISSSSWPWILLQFSTFLLTKLKEKQLENMSVIRLPGENSGSIGENKGNIPRDLVWESGKWPLIKDFWQFVKDPMLCGLDGLTEGRSSFKRFFSMWLSGSLRERMSNVIVRECGQTWTRVRVRTLDNY